MNPTTVSGPNRGRRLRTILVAAGVASALTTGSYLTWSANADEPHAPTADRTTQLHSAAVNLDSLYRAKAEETGAADTAVTVALQPERMINGRVSWYGPGFHGRRTANGERFDRNEMTAAHKSLPFGTLVRVVDEGSGRSVLVRVNDRGPYCGGRVLDLSEAAARRLGIIGRGTASTRLEICSSPKTIGDRAITFDIQGRPMQTNAFTVALARFDNFDDAIARQYELEKDGYTDLYLTQSRQNGKFTYVVSRGLFASESLCGTLLAEMADRFSDARITSFGSAAIEDAGGTKLADTLSDAGETL